MSDTAVLLLISAFLAPALLVFLNWILSRPQRRAIERIDNQVNNDHVDDPQKTSNLREDIDEKHNTVVSSMRQMSRAMVSIMRDIGGIRDDIRQLRRDLSHTDGRVDELERTRPNPNLRNLNNDTSNRRQLD